MRLKRDPIYEASHRAVDQGAITRELVGLGQFRDTTDDKPYATPGWVSEGAPEGVMPGLTREGNLPPGITLPGGFPWITVAAVALGVWLMRRA